MLFEITGIAYFLFCYQEDCKSFIEKLDGATSSGLSKVSCQSFNRRRNTGLHYQPGRGGGGGSELAMGEVCGMSGGDKWLGEGLEGRMFMFFKCFCSAGHPYLKTAFVFVCVCF